MQFKQIVVSLMAAGLAISANVAMATPTLVNTQESTGTYTIDRTGELLQNATLDMTDIRRSAYTSEGAVSESKITDGTVSTVKANIYRIGYDDYFVWDLGSAATGYKVTTVKVYFAWTSNDRSGCEMDAIYYTTVDDPDTWVKVDCSNSGNAQKQCWSVTVTDTTGTLATRVKKVKVVVSSVRYAYGGLAEIAVYGEALTCADGESYDLANAATGSSEALSTGTAAVSGLTVPDGCDLWQQTESSSTDDLDADGWQSTDSLPTVQNFTAPSADADIVLYTWFKSSTDATALPYRCASRPIRFTSAAPTITAPAELTRILRKKGSLFNIAEDGITLSGGTSSGGSVTNIELSVTGAAYELVSGGTDADDDPQSIRVMTAGSYVFRVTATNSAGVVSTQDIAVTITGDGDYGTNEWTGSTSSDPTVDGNWSLGMVPLDGDDVDIPAAYATALSFPAGEWPKFGKFGALTVASGATITLGSDTTVTGGKGVTIKAESMTLAGAFDGKGLGFGANAGPGAGTDGASHGGAGYWLYASYGIMPTIMPYGDPKEPTTLGSGANGSTGGGALHLVCDGALALDGSIDVSASGRGSGGSVWIECGAFSGAGSIDARGGNYQSRSGAGGRVALVYSTSTFTGTVDLSMLAANGYTTGEAGTLYEPGRFVRGTAANPAAVTLSGNVQYVLDDGDWYWNVTVDGSSTDVGLLIGDGTVHLGDYVQTAGILHIGTFYHGDPDMVTKAEIDSIALSGSAQLALPPARDNPTLNLTSLSVESGATLWTGIGDWTYANEESGGTAATPYGRGQTLKVSGDATIGGTLSAHQRGFGRGYGYSSADGGSPHGGATIYSGTNGTGTHPGIGSVTYPTELGGISQYLLQFGGGAVALSVAGTLTVGGTIDVRPNGQGAGGSILIEAAHFAGAGTLTASADEYSCSRYGGGGRIAIYTPDNTFTGSTLVQTIYSAVSYQTSYPGTVFTETSANTNAYAFGDGPRLRTAYSQGSFDSGLGVANASSDAFLGNRTVTAWADDELAWTENWSCRTSGTKYANTATNELSGLTESTIYVVTVNGAELVNPDQTYGHYVTDAAGKLAFIASLTASDNAVTVTRAPRTEVALNAPAVDNENKKLTISGTLDPVGFGNTQFKLYVGDTAASCDTLVGTVNATYGDSATDFNYEIDCSAQANGYVTYRYELVETADGGETPIVSEDSKAKYVRVPASDPATIIYLR